MDNEQLLKTVRELFKDKPSILVREQAFLGHGGKRVDDGSIVTPPSHVVISVKDHVISDEYTIAKRLIASEIPFQVTHEHGWTVFVLT